ncbi:MAG: phage tail tape measure protein [Gemmatimonadaceae bacterium]|nr:phage tail tape measure protein [Gemmatimonadaceae bacterium]
MAANIQTNLLLKVSADIAGAKNGLGTLSNQINGLGSTVAKVAGLIGGAFALRDVIATTQQWGLQLDNLHDTLGLSGDAAAKFNYQARVVGTTADDVATAFGQLTNKIGNSLPAIQSGTDDFSKWGIKVLDSNNAMLGTEAILEQVREKVNALGPGLGARQLEMDLFGRAGGRLHDFLALSNEELRQMAQDLKDLHLPTNVDELEAMNREGNRLGFIFDSIKIKLGSALLPVLLAAGRGLASLAGYVKVLGEALRYPLGIIKEVIDRMGAFITQIKDQGVVAAVASLATDIVSKIGEILGNVGSWVSENLPKWREALGRLWEGMTLWLANTGWPALVTFMETKVPAFADWIVKSLPTWTANLGALITNVLQWWISTGLPAVVQGLGTGSTQIGGWLLNAIGWMSNVGLPTAMGTLFAIGGAIKVGIVSGLGDLIRSMGFGWFLDAIGWISNVGVPMAFDTLKAIGGAIARGIADGMGSLATLIWNIIKNAIPGLGLITDLLRGTDNGPSGGGTFAPEPETFVGVPVGGKTPKQKALIRPDAIQGTDRFGNAGYWTSDGGGAQFTAMALGGIVTSPTRALIGEAGPEAVIPLDRAGGMGATIINVTVSGNITRSEKDLADIVSREIMRSLGNRRAVAF